MKKYNQSMHAGRVIDPVLAEDFLKKPLSDGAIIALQDTLLTPGVHYIKAHDPQFMRPVIMKFLQALNCFHTILFLSAQPLSAEHASCAVINELYGDLVSHLEDHDFIYDFLVRECFPDFVWIEGVSSFASILPVLLDLHMDQQVPIIIIG